MIFTAHSLPVRTLADGSLRCKRCDCEIRAGYRDGLQETADLVAGRAGLEHYRIAWQSAGRTADPWWGPAIEDVIRQLARPGIAAVVVCSAGFVADHLEMLYDLDIEAQADRRGGGHRVRSHARCRTPIPRSSTCSPTSSAITLAPRPVARGLSGDGAATHGSSSSAAASRGLTVAYRLTRPADRGGARRHRRSRPTSRVGGKLRSIEVGDLALPGGRRLVRRAQAVGRRALPRARASRS